MQTDATSHNIVGCVLLGVFSQQCCVRLHVPKSLTGFKLYATSATSANTVVVLQTDATCWAQRCCVRLYGPQLLSLVAYSLKPVILVVYP